MMGQRSISGQVMSEDKEEPIIGANVINTTTQDGTITDLDGLFTITASDGDRVVISYIGFGSQEFVVGASNDYVVRMSAGQELDEVVVTALNISRDKKSLGYAVEEMKGEEIQEANQANVLNAIQGKMAGVYINSSSGAPGAGADIIIRGLNSLDPSRSNSPLFVIDGIPIDNSTRSSGAINPSAGSNSPDRREQASFTNRAADIDPNDIESISVLKGAAATALYGLRGANGVVIINTKKAKEGKANVDYRVNFGLTEVATRPELQSTYREGRFGRLRFRGNGAPLRFQTFGPKVVSGETPLFDPIEDFFQTGSNVNHSLSVSGTSEKAEYVTTLSYDHTDGVIPNSDWRKLNARLSAGYQIAPKIKINGGMMFSNTGGNRPISGDKSVLSSLSYHTTSFDVNDYQNEDGSQRDFSDGIIDNPRYLAEFVTYDNDVNRIIGNLTLNAELTPWLQLMLRGGGDNYSDVRTRIVPPGLDVSSQVNGFIVEERYNYREINGTAMLSTALDLSDELTLDISTGLDAVDRKSDDIITRGEGYAIPGFNSILNTTNLFNSKAGTAYRLAGLYGIARLGYRNALYLEVTGRNDWSSTLPAQNNSFFYPSVSASWVLSEMVDLGSQVDFVKLRASWAKVGKDADPFLLNRNYVLATNFPFGNIPGFDLNNTVGDENLKPEFTTGIEVGAELRFLKNRAGIEFSYYNNESDDLILSVPVTNATGVSRYVTNAGSVSNTGIELVGSLTPVQNKNWQWDILANWSTNEGDVQRIADGIEEIVVYGDRISSILREGGKVGDLYGWRFNYSPDGQLLIGSNGYPSTNFDETVVVGNGLPDWTAGLTNSFRYKSLRLSVFMDWRQGGDLYDVGFRNALRNGTLAETERRYEEVVFGGVVEDDNGNFSPNTQAVQIDGESLYRSGTRYNNSSEILLQDGSWFRIRNISLSYAIPDKLLSNVTNQVLSSARLIFSMNNVYLNTPFRGYDPETNYFGSGSNIFGYTGLQVPATRGYNITLDVSF